MSSGASLRAVLINWQLVSRKQAQAARKRRFNKNIGCVYHIAGILSKLFCPQEGE
jgi:hypothetical protein